MLPGASVRRRPAGTTLMEMMTVVAIIGILSAMGGSALLDVLVASRVTSTSKSLSGALGGARVRAASSNCPHYVQVNGPAYAGTGAAGFVTQPGVIAVMRKANCASTTLRFEPGDRAVDRVALGPEELPGAVELLLPAAVLSSQTLTNQSVVFAYDRLGARFVSVDATGAGESGFAEVSGVASVPVRLILHENASTPKHPLAVVLPIAGAAIIGPVEF
jgi:prepilin-type N-terminal cleavage/methylation domain-containing protein